MAARRWTDAKKAAQSKAIHTWKPWKCSTGARTLEGKSIVSRNAYRGGSRQLIRFSRWLYRAIEHPETLTAEIVEAAKHRSIDLLSGNAGHRAASITKLIAKCNNLSETEVADLQELAKAQEDFKNSLLQKPSNKMDAGTASGAINKDSRMATVTALYGCKKAVDKLIVARNAYTVSFRQRLLDMRFFYEHPDTHQHYFPA